MQYASMGGKFTIPNKPKGKCNSCKLRTKVTVGLCRECHDELITKYKRK